MKAWLPDNQHVLDMDAGGVDVPSPAELERLTGYTEGDPLPWFTVANVRYLHAPHVDLTGFSTVRGLPVYVKAEKHFEAGYGVWGVTEEDYVCAQTLEQGIAWYKRETACEFDDLDFAAEPEDLEHIAINEDTPGKGDTFRNIIREQIAKHWPGPFLAASTEA